MKKLMIQSNTPKEDIEAASIITKAMLTGDQDQIVWFSHMGRHIEKMIHSTEKIQKMEETVSFQNLEMAKFASKLSELKYEILKINDSLKNLNEKINEQIVSKKRPIKKLQDKNEISK